MYQRIDSLLINDKQDFDVSQWHSWVIISTFYAVYINTNPESLGSD